MAEMDFDERYPAMFQPGGEGHIREHHAPEHLLPPKGDPAPPLQFVAETGVKKVPGLAHEVGPADAEGSAPHRAAVRQPHWGIRSWVLGLSAILLTFAAAAFCLFAAALIPAARSSDPSDFHGVLMIPWGIAILPGTPALMTAGLVMLAALFLAASRHYAKHAWWFHGAAAAVGLAAVAGGTVSMFSDSLFAEMLYNPTTNQSNTMIPWYMVFQQASWPLLLLGMAVLALTVVMPPDRNGSPGAPSAAAALWMGAVLTTTGVWAWFAPQSFPLAEGRTVNVSEDQSYMVQAWTYVVGQAGGPLLTVGLGALFWGLLILATTRRGSQEQSPEDPEMATEHDGELGQTGGYAQQQL